MTEQERIKSFIEDELLVGQSVDVGYDDDLLLSGLVNSLGVMRLVGFLENEFGIQVPADEITIDHFQTINAISGYVQSRKAA